MKLMPSQVHDVRQAIRTSGLQESDFLLSSSGEELVVGFEPNPEYQFRIECRPDKYVLFSCPGRSRMADNDVVPEWNDYRVGTVSSHPGVRSRFGQWLSDVKREWSLLSKPGNEGASPQWALDALPPQFQAGTDEIARLREDVDRIESMGRLLWQTGTPLEEAVCDVFRAAGLSAERSPEGTTYDVEVKTKRQVKLLLEVTGINGKVKKESRKIGQALAAIQKHAQEPDRVAVVANTQRETPPADRDPDPITPDALNILKGIGVAFVTTADLFEAWKRIDTDQKAGKAKLLALFALEDDTV